MEYTPMHFSERAAERHRFKDCHCYPKKIYLRVIVPAPKEHLKYNSDLSSISSAVPRRYTMVAKEMSFELGKVVRYDTYGEIRLAHSTTSSKIIAVKCIRKNQPQMQGYVKYILPREIALLKMLKGHPNVISFIGVLDTNHYAMVATEHVEGKSLMEFIRMKHSIREDEARVIFRELLSTVITCHSLGISIRGLSCENILLDKSLTPKVSTFEHAIVRGYDKVDFFEGTPSSPPEVFEGKDYDSKQVDVWTLGIILYTMVTGAHPCSEDNLDQTKKFSHLSFPSYMSSSCCKVVERMLHSNPRKRIGTSELKRDNWVNDLTLRSVEYQLACDTDTNSEDDVSLNLKSAKLRAIQTHHCNAMQNRHHEDCDFCKSRFNMKNDNTLESTELSDMEKDKHFHSHRNKQKLASVKALTREKNVHRKVSTSRKKRCSLSTGRISYMKGETYLSSNSGPKKQKHDIRCNKSMESVSVATNNSDNDKCTDKESGSCYSNNKVGNTDTEIHHFLNEERKHLADTNIILSEEKKFLDQFARYLEQTSRPCAATSISGINILPTKGHLLDKSTSYDRRFHASKTTSFSPRRADTPKKHCDVEVDAVVDTANQLIQWNENGSVKSKSDAYSKQLKSAQKGSQKTTILPETDKTIHRIQHSVQAEREQITVSDIFPVEIRHPAFHEVQQKSSTSSKTSETEPIPSSGSNSQCTDDQSQITVKDKKAGAALPEIQSQTTTKQRKSGPSLRRNRKKSISTGQIGVESSGKKSIFKKFFSLFKLKSSSDSRILSFRRSKNATPNSSDHKVQSLIPTRGVESMSHKLSDQSKQTRKQKGQSNGSVIKRKIFSTSFAGNRKTSSSFRKIMMQKTKSSTANVPVNREKIVPVIICD